MQTEIYSTTEPYPKPDRLDRNIRYARMLLDLYSGRSSKLTAAHRYAYHYLIAGLQNAKATGCLREIAKAEMLHLELLGDCIGKLGIYPAYSFYQGTRRVRWNSGFVQYGRNLRDMIGIDIQEEICAIGQFEQVARRINDQQIQALLRRIIQDDEQHMHMLTALRQELWPRGSGNASK